MTLIGTHIAAVLAAGAAATGAVFGVEAGAGDDGAGPTATTALVIDASLAREGRELVDRRLQDVDAEVRLPRDAEEARVNVRYFDELDYRVYVAGAQATEAAEETGVDATAVEGLAGALAAGRSR